MKKLSKEELEIWRQIYGGNSSKVESPKQVAIVDRIKEIMGIKKNP